MKFLIDMPLSPELAVWLSQNGHDALHVSDLGMARAQDVEILERAWREKRVVISADLDYPRLLALSQSEGPGLILLRGGNFSEQQTRDRLEQCLNLIPHEDLPNSIIVIEHERIRQRRLPI